MANLLRQIVAGPRARHPEAGLDLCYVTDEIVATSGPSQTYPQRAYRNPLDQLVKFLDDKHGSEWAIWEFRGEGTGYPDNLVYNRIRHYPWPDHHPPPFRLVPMIIASMRNWLNGNDLHADGAEDDGTASTTAVKSLNMGPEERKDRRGSLVERVLDTWKDTAKKGAGRVVVVHCKAGKGRSGTMACAFLIAERGWTPEQAMARFTERRMRPRMGSGVSIPSQIRTIGYVERWARAPGRPTYVDRPVEILEVHVWGLRNGVKLGVEGFVDGGRRIKVFHTFSSQERNVVEGNPPGGSGMVDMMYDMAGYGADSPPTAQEEQEVLDETRKPNDNTIPDSTTAPSTLNSAKAKINRRTSTLIRRVSRKAPAKSSESPKDDSSTPDTANPNGYNTRSSSTSSLPKTKDKDSESEPGGKAVIFKPTEPILIPNSDVSVTLERRNRAPSSMGLTVVTAVAHVWFNTYFEGNGPEQGGRPDNEGIFSIDWDKMDGIKGSSQKGTRAADRIAVVWRTPPSSSDPQPTTKVGESAGAQGTSQHPQPEKTATESGSAGDVIHEPGVDSPVPQMPAADWHGGNDEDPGTDKGLGVRVRSPESADVSQASSVHNAAVANLPADIEKRGKAMETALLGATRKESDQDSPGAPEKQPAGASSDASDGGKKVAAGHREPEEEKKLEAYAEKLPKPEGAE